MASNDQQTEPLMYNAAINGYRSWPFDTSRLFYTQREHDEAKKNPSYKMKGIFSYKHACGFIYAFADRVRRETGRLVSAVILQQEDSAGTQPTNPANGNRIDIDLLNNVTNNRCSYALCGRNCGNECIKLENAVAKTVLGKTKAELENVTQAETLKTVLGTFVNKSNPPSKTPCDPCYAEAGPTDSEHEKSHIYYQYNCPMTLIGGVMMPVIVNGIVIAAVIVGQFIWSPAHKEAITKKNDGCGECSDYNQKREIIQILTESVTELEGSLEQRLNRNASGLFSEIANDVHVKLTQKKTLNQKELKDAAEDTVQYLMEKLTATELVFYPLDRRVMTDGKDAEPFGNQRNLPAKVQPESIDSVKNKQIAKNRSETVFLTVPATRQYSLHLFDDAGKELCRMSFIPKLSAINLIKQQDQNTLCYHMETALQELYMQWALVQREEEHAQFNLTMLQFTHELGQKSHSGNASMLQMHRQLEMLRRLSGRERGDQLARSAEIEKLERTAKDMDSIFDGIEYLSQLARTKAQGLKFNPSEFDIRYAVLNSLAAQYRIDIRVRGMKIIYRSADRSYNRIYGDRELIHIAVHNLISNAVKYGYPGTKIYYSCYRGEDSRGRRGTIIDVVDYGLYIKEEDRERIFDNKTRMDGASRNDSMGYGLFLTKQIMELHGGYYEVAESKVVSAFSAPCLEEMLRYQNKPPKNLAPDFDAIQEALQDARDTELFEDAVNRSVRVDEDSEMGITVRGLFSEGMRPMAKTTMRLFFPDKEEF